MSSRALRDVILRAMHGSLITGLAVTGCHETVPAAPDAGPSRDAGVGGAGGKLWRDGGGVAGRGGRNAPPLPENCFENPVGRCCRELVCFPKPASSEGDAGATGSDDAGQVAAACPQSRQNDGFCTSYGSLQSEQDGECCYIRTQGNCCGRPFLDGAHMLLAPVCSRTDWLEPVDDVVDLAEASFRGALASAWLRDAQLEHASIASFSRFSLQLLALGAPAALVVAAQRAALDEVDHAQACFALASRFAGRPLGPSALPMPASLVVSSLAGASAAAVHEGCVAETIAARIAYEQLQHASDEQAQAVLIRIATDETGHAALAYQFVRWALSVGGAEVCAAVQVAFDSARQQLLAATEERDADVPTDVWHAHGRLSAKEQRACELSCLRDVIEPCFRSLMDDAQPDFGSEQVSAE
jgi:hypothetical protein